jgi:cyclohexanecarboxylate-CoA ligase
MNTFSAPATDVTAYMTDVVGSSCSGVWESGSWHSWEACHERSEHFSRILSQAGLGAGDVVAVQLPNSMALTAMHLASARLGLRLFPIHLAYGPLETRSLVARAGAVAFISQAEYRGRQRQSYLEQIRVGCPSLRTMWLRGGDSILKEWWTAGPAPDRHADKRMPYISEFDPGILLASSGTTAAEPKVCVHRHAGLLENVAAVAEDVGFDSSDTFLAAGPMSHAFGLSSFHLALVTGGGLGLVDQWDPAAFTEAMHSSSATVVMAVPAQLRDLIAWMRQTKTQPPRTLREVRTGGATVPPSLIADAVDCLGARLVVQWGMTEIGVGTYTKSTEQSLRGGVGQPVPGASVRVVRPDGGPAEPGEVGKLEVESPYAFSGYIGASSLGRPTQHTDRWLVTGDLAALDTDGALILHGRADERINRGGLKFSASEVEALLAGMPQLRQHAIVARPDRRLGERSALVAVLSPGCSVSLAEVTEHLQRQGIASYKLPESLIIMDAIPTNAIGKIARAKLRSLLSPPSSSDAGAQFGR